MMKADQAQAIGLQALGFLAARDELLMAFLGASGLSLAELRGRAGDPDLLAAVMDFCLGDESLLRDFCAEAGLRMEDPMQARMALPGGDVPHWT